VPVAVTSLDDFSRWARGDGLEIVLLVLGSVLLTRAVTWFSTRLTARVDAADEQSDAVVRSEAAKHRHSLAQAITWAVVALIYAVTAVLVLDRFGVPLATLIAPATVAGVALGFGAQRIVQDILAGFFIIAERQYGYGDLIRIANLNDIRAEVDVNEADLNRVHLGQPAEVTPDAYPDAHYAAEVVKLYPQVDRQKGTLRIEVHIPKPDTRLLPDMSARITFLSEPPPPGQVDTPVVLAPVAALRRDEHGDNFVWIVNDARVHRGRVETAGNVGQRVRIASGLKGGEALVLGDTPLRDGQRVTLEE